MEKIDKNYLLISAFTTLFFASVFLIFLFLIGYEELPLLLRSLIVLLSASGFGVGIYFLGAVSFKRFTINSVLLSLFVIMYLYFSYPVFKNNFPQIINYQVDWLFIAYSFSGFFISTFFKILNNNYKNTSFFGKISYLINYLFLRIIGGLFSVLTIWGIISIVAFSINHIINVFNE